jgi:hypothetical protein
LAVVVARQHSTHCREQLLRTSEQVYQALVHFSSTRALSRQAPVRAGGIVVLAAGTPAGAIPRRESSQAASARTARNKNTALCIIDIPRDFGAPAKSAL